MFEPFATTYDPFQRLVYRVTTIEEIKEIAVQIYIQAETLTPAIEFLREYGGNDRMLGGIATIAENFQKLATEYAESIETSLIGREKAGLTAPKVGTR